jgi:protein-arginine kinase activator protein McsA
VDRLHSLQSKLDKAVAKEDYEKAAQLRDEISQVKLEYSEITIS